jgi:hypothetical protein
MHRIKRLSIRKDTILENLNFVITLEIIPLGLRSPTTLIRNRTTPIDEAIKVTIFEFMKGPIIEGLEVNLIRGINAKGN